MATGLENLKIYQMAKELELQVFELTQKFPLDEKYRTVDQLRRSSSSVTSNIAEAYSRWSVKDKVRILRDIVRGETEETKSGLEVSLKKGFHTNADVISKYTELLKAINGYIRFLRERFPSSFATK